MALDSAFAGKSVLQQEAADLMEIDSMSSDHDSIPDPYQGMSQADIDAAKAAVPYVPANRPGPTAGPKAVLADAAAHADDQRRGVCTCSIPRSVHSSTRTHVVPPRPHTALHCPPPTTA